MARLPQPVGEPVTVNSQVFEPGRGLPSKRYWRLLMSIKTILLIIALICFIIDALGSRMKFRAPFGLLPGGLAFLTAAFLF